jgi:hypothetical protein
MYALLEIVACGYVPTIQEGSRATVLDAAGDLFRDPGIIASMRDEYAIPMLGHIPRRSSASR